MKKLIYYLRPANTALPTRSISAVIDKFAVQEAERLTVGTTDRYTLTLGTKTIWRNYAVIVVQAEDGHEFMTLKSGYKGDST
jgi:hypothetical protein